MFDQFPKKRPPLQREIRNIRTAHYRSNREGGSPASSLAKRMESWLHAQVAADLGTPEDRKKNDPRTGGGHPSTNWRTSPVSSATTSSNRSGNFTKTRPF